MKKPVLGFGQHLMVDGYGCSQERLVDLDGIYEFLNKCPDLIKMTKIMPPYVFKYSGKYAQDWGLSGFVLIAESHISVHTFPEKAYLSLDVFSCKNFDYRLALEYATEHFQIASYEIKFLDRGLEFPREIQAVTHYLRDERKQMRV